jgi:hypothetical protein
MALLIGIQEDRQLAEAERALLVQRPQDPTLADSLFGDDVEVQLDGDSE